MKLSDYLPVQQISMDLQSDSKFPLIEELLDMPAENGRLLDRDQALQDVLAREGYLSTGLENGIAIPHAKTDGVDKLILAFGIKRDGIDFESLDGKPASLIFLALSPRDTAGPHIKSLAIISRTLKDLETRQALMDAASVEEIADIIKEKFNS
jgi:fructose-specific phosphotransferase system IIA component